MRRAVRATRGADPAAAGVTFIRVDGGGSYDFFISYRWTPFDLQLTSRLYDDLGLQVGTRGVGCVCVGEWGCVCGGGTRKSAASRWGASACRAAPHLLAPNEKA